MVSTGSEVIGLAHLPAGRVEVRLVSLAVDESELKRLQSFLTADELQRGNRLLDPQRRNAFFAGRGMLREMLAEKLHLEPGQVKLVEGKFGKPRVKEGQNSSSIRFNLSHAGGYLLVAFAAGREVGIDLEQVRPELAYGAMGERYFSPREREELFGLAQDGQIQAFYRCWTRKEAYMKGSGTGFSQPSTSFDVSLLPDAPPALLEHRAAPDESSRWSIEDVSVPEGYCAALAIEKTEESGRACSPPSPCRPKPRQSPPVPPSQKGGTSGETPSQRGDSYI